MNASPPATPPFAEGHQPVIVNQIDAEFGDFLATLPCRPKIIEMAGTETPWDIPAETEILVTRALRSWRDAPGTAPDLPALRWVQLFSAGIDVYPRWLFENRTVSNGSGLTAPQIAEYVLAAILRREKDLDSLRVTRREDWATRQVGGVEGKVLALIGFGAIGQQVARRAAAFGMQVIASRSRPWGADTMPGITPCDDPAELAALADHLVLAAPLTPATRHIVNGAFLARMKPGAHLINISRGGLIDQEALLKALDTGRPGYATLDVTDPEPLPEEHPLWTHPQVLLTPHISYLGGTEMARFSRLTAEGLDRVLRGLEPGNVVSLARGY